MMVADRESEISSSYRFPATTRRYLFSFEDVALARAGVARDFRLFRDIRHQARNFWWVWWWV